MGKKAAKNMKDVYEHSDEEAEDSHRHDIDGVYEYEAPENFQDEEIDEDEAFNTDDEDKYGIFFTKKQDRQDYSDDEEEASGDLLSDLLDSNSTSRLPVAGSDEGENETDGDHSGLLDMVNSLASDTKKKQKAVERGEVGRESEHDVRAAGATSLSLSALLGGEEKEITASDAALKQQLNMLVHNDGSSRTLSAPVSRANEERATRKSVYAQKSKDISLFQAAVNENRETETLDFRSQLPRQDRLSNTELSTKFKPESAMEKSVQALLSKGKLTQELAQTGEDEELEQRSATKEEIESRRKELRRMRTLMFYEEQKAKRVKKIKSKMYHKIRNKRKAKDAPDGESSMEPEEEAEAAKKRAEERMTLKHTNTSKWIKHQLKRGINADENSRNAIARQLEEGQRLRRRVAAQSDDESDTAGGLNDVVLSNTEALVAEIDDDQKGIAGAKGLFGMKFMQRAVEKQREKAKAQAEELLQELTGRDVSEDNEKPITEKTEKVCVPGEDISTSLLPRGSLQTTTVMQGGVRSTKVSDRINTSGSQPSENPWVGTIRETTTRGSKNKTAPSSAVLNVEGLTDLDTAKIPHHQATVDAQSDLVKRAFSTAHTDESAREEIEKEKEAQAASAIDPQLQREVTKLVGTDGWGSWAGEGSRPSRWVKQRRAEAEKMLESAKQKALEKRNDRRMGTVLINETKDKNAGKFMCNSVPYPFTSREQYELAMRNPLGPDWNTTKSTSNLTKPSVIVPAGAILEPLRVSKRHKSDAAASGRRKARF